MVQAARTAALFVPNALKSDTAESVVGTEWHQEAIGALAEMLRDADERRGTGWGVCEQIALVGLRHEDGSDYDPRPDVMVLSQPLPRGSMASIHLNIAGAPLFIAEAASEGTKGNDQGDKRHAYEQIGVAEYIVFDPDGSLLAAPLLAWRLQAGHYVPWHADAEGWWQSTVLGISFQPGHPFLVVRDHDGTIIPPMRDVRRRARDLDKRARDLDQRLAREVQARADLEEQLHRLRAERDEPDAAPRPPNG